ncbi:MAG: NAD+ synthase [Bacteroidetes bacterium]|nr:NAD+ synthase [Bacteroidota bacterium]
MKIALAQLNYHIGNFEKNTASILNSIKKAKNTACDLIVFAELAICGYPPRDFLEFTDFIEQCHLNLQQIAAEAFDIAVIVGLPTHNPDKKGKNLFNSAAFICNGKIQSLHHKSLLPNYDVFDEYRYFEPSRNSNIIDFKGYKIALTICEDLWNIGEEQLYPYSPMDDLIAQHPDIMINIAASPFNYEQVDKRKAVLINNVLKYKIPLLYVNHVGAQTELIFDGSSLAINSNANIICQLKSFEEDFRIFDTDVLNSKDNSIFQEIEISKIESIHNALVLGIKDYFAKLGFKKAILGLSGGIDSAVTLVLAAKALGPENVKAILLPSQFSSQHSIDDALKLAENLKVAYEIIPIEEDYNSFENSLSPYFKGLPHDVTEENLQARIRAVVLMAFCNKFGYVLLNTSNKSEAAVGYGTLYGDMCGGLSVLGDLYKTEVYELAHFINKDKELIPHNSIIKPPSAELRPNQKDIDSLPDYEILDKILYQYIEKRKGPKELINMGFDEAIVKKTLKLVNTNEYKRYQTPPILRISPKAFGMGRRLPIVGKYLS